MILALAAVVGRKHRQGGGVEQTKASHECLADGRIRHGRRAGSKRIKKWVADSDEMLAATRRPYAHDVTGAGCEFRFQHLLASASDGEGNIGKVRKSASRGIVDTCAGHGYGWNRRQVGGVEQMYQVSALRTGKSSTAIVPDPCEDLRARA